LPSGVSSGLNAIYREVNSVYVHMGSPGYLKSLDIRYTVDYVTIVAYENHPVRFSKIFIFLSFTGI
jgi:hypothetical protein